MWSDDAGGGRFSNKDCCNCELLGQRWPSTVIKILKNASRGFSDTCECVGISVHTESSFYNNWILRNFD